MRDSLRFVVVFRRQFRDIVAEPFGMQVLLWDRRLNVYHDAVRSYGFDQYNF